tara:strand:+ start:981 stop:1316 length:336 start_codon:yes stop_codon:yes gene_type:complete
MAVYSNLTIDQGTDFSSNIDVTDADGDRFNLTGYTAKGQIRKSYQSSTAVDFTCTVSNAAAGIVTIALTAAQSNGMKAGRFVYDIEITSSGGAKTRVLEGQVEITPGVTQT